MIKADEVHVCVSDDYGQKGQSTRRVNSAEIYALGGIKLGHENTSGKSGKRTRTFFAPGRHARPVSEEALRGVVPLEHVAVPALELPNHAVVQPRGHDEAVLGSLGELSAFRWKKK